MKAKTLAKACLFALLFPLVPNVQAAKSERFIVVFDPVITTVTQRRDIARDLGAVVERSYHLVPAIAVSVPAHLSRAVASALRAHTSVRRVEPDILFHLNPKKEPKKPAPVQPSQQLPWGVDRIDAELVYGYSSGEGVNVAIVDTGIDVDHPDIAANIAGGINIINPRRLYDDDNGHGTHVAGIIAAQDNGIGIIGVAPKSALYGVKVLRRDGSGWLSDIIAGLQWCVDNHMDVINMSLGSTSDAQVFHDAVAAVHAAGVVQVAAAGNDGGTVSYPAAYDQTIAVSATDESDTLTPWSNFGAQVTVAAPGNDILSAYNDGGYVLLSGTSMASPHVAGVAALILENQPDATPDQVRSAISTSAESLGLPAVEQGSGLVDAQEAVMFTE